MGSLKIHILFQFLLISFICLCFSQDLVIKNLDTLAPSGVITAEFNGQSYRVTYQVEKLNGGDGPVVTPPSPPNNGKNVNYTLCDPNNRPEACTMEFRGVCAFVEGCLGGQCVRTSGTGCQACADPTIYAWMDGTCEDIQSACDPNVNPAAISCPAEPQPACGIKADCRGDDCIQTAVNACNACAASANFSLPTECPPKPAQATNTNFTLCDPNNRPEFCTKEFRGVCAFVEGCKGGKCVKTIGTECQACADFSVYAWMEGTCEDLQSPCDPNINPAAISCLADPQLACGIKANCTGDDCAQTAVNGCNACAASANFSLPTECPPKPVKEVNNTNYTLCDPKNRPEVCTEEFRGVCAFIEGCKGGKCVKTTGTECQACADSSVYAWMEGTCEDLQSPCDPNIDPALVDCINIYQPACGIKLDCKGADCIQTGPNACNTCAARANFSLPTQCPPQPAGAADANKLI